VCVLVYLAVVVPVFCVALELAEGVPFMDGVRLDHRGTVSVDTNGVPLLVVGDEELLVGVLAHGALERVDL
jgi:hypothetical protein